MNYDYSFCPAFPLDFPGILLAAVVISNMVEIGSSRRDYGLPQDSVFFEV
jgi:hypothetical protein